MAIVYVGIDLAKNVFAVHGVNQAGKVELVRPSVPRAKLHELIASLPPCVIGMEACSGAHHWARLFGDLGHTVRLMAPKFVAPYRLSGKRGKNDAADAAAICEAVQRPNMRFVPIKSVDQQARLTLHRTRQGFVEQRTATMNRIRGLLSEFGVVLPLKAATVRREAAAGLEALPGWARLAIGDLLNEVRRLDERVVEYDRHLAHLAREDERARRLMRLSGVGETTATALLATIGKRPRLPLWPAIRGLAGAGAEPIQFRRQDAAGAHHQNRRPVPPNPVDPGRPSRAGPRQNQDRRHQPLGGGAGATPRVLEGGRRHRRQERALGLGRAQQGRDLQDAGLIA